MIDSAWQVFEYLSTMNPIYITFGIAIIGSQLILIVKLIVAKRQYRSLLLEQQQWKQARGRQRAIVVEESERAQQFNQICDLIPNAMLILDTHQRIQYANLRAKRLLENGLDAQIIGLSLLEFIELAHARGSSIEQTEQAIPMTYEGQLASCVIFAEPDIHRLSESLEGENKDALTGIYNRIYLDGARRKLFEQSSVSNTTQSLILIDLDQFKLYNEQFGRLEGDHCLIRIATAIRRIVEEHNITDSVVARYDGDQFAILLPHTTEQEAEAVAQRITDAIAGQNITVSVGIATQLSKTYESADQWMDAADKQLVAAKQVPRTLSVMQDDSPPHHAPSLSEVVAQFSQEIRAYSNDLWKHSNRLSYISVALGRKLECNEEQLMDLHYAALLHDIGKLELDPAITRTDQSLSAEQDALMKEHPRLGEQKLQHYDVFLERPAIARGVLYHHEQWDGQGYPEALEGDDIPFIARIIAVADAFDVMYSGTSNKQRLELGDVIKELKRNRDKQFDAEVVDALLECIHDNPKLKEDLAVASLNPQLRNRVG